MMKAHCDNCDAVVLDANSARRVTIQPWGFQCVVEILVTKQPRLDRSALVEAPQVLCVNCLRAAALAFVESLSAQVGWGDTREKVP